MNWNGQNIALSVFLPVFCKDKFTFGTFFQGCTILNQMVMSRPLEDIPGTTMIRGSLFSPASIIQHHFCLTTPFTICFLLFRSHFSLAEGGLIGFWSTEACFNLACYICKAGPIAGNSLAEYYLCERLYFTVVAKGSDTAWQLQVFSSLRWAKLSQRRLRICIYDYTKSLNVFVLISWSLTHKGVCECS